MRSEKPLFSIQGVLLIIVVTGMMLYLLTPDYGTPQATSRARSGANLRSIASTYVAYLVEGKKSRTLTANLGDTAHTAAYILAHNNQLNDARLWLVTSDEKNFDKTIPETVTVGQPPDDKINPDFANFTLAYEFAANVPPDAPATTTPIAWTRGLRADGTWSLDSPWKGEGGHIAYLDGHVVWVEPKLRIGVNEISLIKYGTNTPTVNIREALPPGAVILSAEPNPTNKPAP